MINCSSSGFNKPYCWLIAIDMWEEKRLMGFITYPNYKRTYGYQVTQIQTGIMLKVI